MAPEAVPTTSSLLRLALEDLSNMLQELGVPWTKAAMADAEANLLSGALVVAPPLSFNSMVPQRLIAADTTVGAAVPSET